MMEQMIFSAPIVLNATRYADKNALTFKGREFTYREFNERINQLGHALQDIGVKKGDKVAFMLFNCNELLEIIYACSKIGAVFVPINSRFVAPEVKHVLDDSESIILIYDQRFSREIERIQHDVHVKEWIHVGQVDDLDSFEYERWIAGFSQAEPVLVEPLYELDTICFLYTGGTTGLPKGAVRSHRSLYMVGLLFSIEFSIGRNGKGLVVGPLFGAAALSISMPNLFVGNSLHIMENFHPLEVLKAIDEEKPTTTFLAPPMFEAIFSLPEEVQNQYDLSSMKSLISVGAPLQTRTKERILAAFPGVELNEFYGASEHGGSTNLYPEYQEKKDRSVGLPMLGMQVKLLNEEKEEVAPHEVGEFFVKGLTLCDGYYNNPTATEEAFQDGWLGLGDLVSQDEEGFYYIVDRKQDMILSGAINVYPAEIEEVLYKHPKIADVAVIGIPHEKWGEVPMAIIVKREGESLEMSDIRTFCEGHLDRFKLPHSVDFVSDLPRSLQGKLLKFQIRDKYRQEKEAKSK